jgi:hypothetical protein
MSEITDFDRSVVDIRERSKRYPKGVHLCNSTNSTIFTNCCNAAITDRDKQCPKCRYYIVGWDSKNVNKTRWLFAYKK